MITQCFKHPTRHAITIVEVTHIHIPDVVIEVGLCTECLILVERDKSIREIRGGKNERRHAARDYRSNE